MNLFDLLSGFLLPKFRVFCDRLVDEKDRESFVAMLSENLGAHFDQTYHNICTNKQPPVFGKYFFANWRFSKEKSFEVHI